MAKIIIRSASVQAYQFVFLSAGISIIISLLLGFFGGIQNSWSAVTGALTWFLPNFLVAYKIFSRIETRTPVFMVTFFIAELLKLVLYGMFFVLLYKFLNISVVYFLIGFMLAQIVFWFSPLLVRAMQK